MTENDPHPATHSPQTEGDYVRRVGGAVLTRFLPGTGIELINDFQPADPPRHALFDFDGTISLIREGWPEVMVPMMVEVLLATGTDESPEALHNLAYDFVMQLNGKQTIYQMIRLAQEVAQRGAQPEEPAAYKQRYHDLLMRRIEGRHADLRSGRTPAEALMVPHALDLLRGLRARGVQLYLASGTDEHYVIAEAEALGLREFFGDRIHGAVDDYRTFSKQMVIDRILREHDLAGGALIGFGDGFVEIDNIKSSGGVAIAVASDEAARSGKPDPWKRDRLIGVGADIVIPDFRDCDALLRFLWREDPADAL